LIGAVAASVVALYALITTTAPSPWWLVATLGAYLPFEAIGRLIERKRDY
jgi:hydrogenase/urease accessory protein HupE